MKSSSKKSRSSFRRGLCASDKSEETEYDEEYNARTSLCCGIICTKSLAMIFNFLFIISGVLLILLGVWTIMTKQDYVNLLSSSLYQASTYTLIVAGGLIVLTGTMGILSAWFESKRLLIAYIVLLLIIFVIEITAGILAFAYRARLKESLKLDLEILILEQYGQEGFESKTKSLDELQNRFKCCGASNFLDWRESKFVNLAKAAANGQSDRTNTTYNKVAESCCKTPSSLCAKRDHPSNINHNGCVYALEKYISKHIFLLGTVGCGICTFQAIGILITVFLIRRINQRKQYGYVKANDY